MFGCGPVQVLAVFYGRAAPFNDPLDRFVDIKAFGNRREAQTQAAKLAQGHSGVAASLLALGQGEA